MNRLKVFMVIAAAAFLLQCPAEAFGPGHGGSGHKKDFEKRMEAKKEEVLKDLNVSAEQRKRLDENKAANMQKMKAAFESMHQSEASLRDELQKEKIDLNKIYKIHDEIKKRSAEIRDMRLAGILEVRQILTTEQFRKFTKKMEEWREQRSK